MVAAIVSASCGVALDRPPIPATDRCQHLMLRALGESFTKEAVLVSGNSAQPLPQRGQWSGGHLVCARFERGHMIGDARLRLRVLDAGGGE